MIEGMSRQTRIVLLGLAGVALVVMLYDASAPWRVGTPVTPATTPALESPRSEIQRGLDKTPLVYPAQFVDALVTRLRDTLVVAVPASGGDPRAGVVIARGEVVVATGQAYDRWRLETATGRTFEAQLISVDPVRGISLLRPDDPLPEEAPVMSFGPPALASGSPVLALLATPTAVVTQLLPAPGTDASLGARLRSGGLAAGTAVVDLDGRLVAFLGTGVRGGLPFTSEDLQNQVLAALRAGAPLAVPWLGADLQDVNAALAGRFTDGLMVVVHVEPGSPAAEAGLRPNDVVTAASVGDVAVGRVTELEERIETGRQVTLAVTRAAPRARARTAVVEIVTGRRRYPMGVNGVTGAEVAEAGVPLDVAPASPLAHAGLRTGDRVEAVEGRAATPAIVERALTAPRGQLLTVRRNGQRRFVVLPTPEATS
jgi:serine protease Do